MRKEGRRRERSRKKGRSSGGEGNNCFSVERNW